MEGESSGDKKGTDQHATQIEEEVGVVGSSDARNVTVQVSRRPTWSNRVQKCSARGKRDLVKKREEDNSPDTRTSLGRRGIRKQERGRNT